MGYDAELRLGRQGTGKRDLCHSTGRRPAPLSRDYRASVVLSHLVLQPQVSEVHERTGPVAGRLHA
eukprot:scaffold5078_cov63-Phaeocystis_antarctica.AAC.7